MSRKRLKQSAKSQISGNIIMLFLMGLITNIFVWVSSINSSILNQTGVTRKYITGMLLGLTRNFQPTPAFYSNLWPFAGIIVGSGLVIMILDYVFGSPLRISLTHTYIELANGKKPEIGMLGFGFKKCWGKSILLCFLHGLFIALWSLLFIIPGIVKAYSYAMANYIMAENPDISALDAITQSRKMMKGHKFDLFILGLSFFFWYLLIIVTLGIASIYVGPYMQAATTNFYMKIKGNTVSTEL